MKPLIPGRRMPRNELDGVVNIFSTGIMCMNYYPLTEKNVAVVFQDIKLQNVSKPACVPSCSHSGLEVNTARGMDGFCTGQYGSQVRYM